MIRLDKYLTEAGFGTRTQVKELIRRGCVTIDGETAKKPEMKIAEETAKVCVGGKPCAYQKYRYYMLNKPAGVVSATEDARDKTVLSFLPGELTKGLFPVGRLDKDTVGLLLLTNDGGLSHALLSPKKHVPKTYLVQTAKPVLEEAMIKLENGVDIGEKKPTLPAKAEYANEEYANEETGKNEIYLTISEGKYHQVKRMLQAVDNEVTALKRISMGSLVLDETLAEGDFRELTKEEIEDLKQGAETKGRVKGKKLKCE